MPGNALLRLCRVKLEFFLHRPFPSLDIYRTPSVREVVLQGGALLNGVSVSSDVKLGKFVCDHLFEMELENTSNSVIMANLYSQADYGRIVEILHSRLLRFDRKNRRASYNSLNLPEYQLAHGPKSVANEF
ncbi:hypothetical protein VitviT2T_014124 [Vitis vinifera]|uniref:Uncharacterized protein n=1 Tax=Vitis vinifera TaxID=29760 RepID=A0ABY9CL63_VITVI|nr:hypothetical protein VitviT2T_014124 [Vitis vinifera]